MTEDGASLGDVNATRVWHRVGDMLDEPPSSPPTVVVKPPEFDDPETVSTFYRTLGATDSDYVGRSDWAANYHSGHRVVVRPDETVSESELEATLAHEFVHGYQSNGRYDVDEDVHVVPRRSVREGTAELLEWRYADRYLDDYDAEHAATAEFRNVWGPQRLPWVPYVYGARYARNHSDPDAPLESMYENPPTTAEQVLHGLEPGSEPPRPLTVHETDTGSWSWDTTSSGRWGEAPLRYALAIGLSRERAAETAAGWGNDRRMTFVSSEGYSYAWVVRWDSPGDAREFGRAFTDYRANVSVPLDLQTVGEETTVLLSGEPSFVENATASGTAGNVTVAA